MPLYAFHHPVRCYCVPLLKTSIFRSAPSRRELSRSQTAARPVDADLPAFSIEKNADLGVAGAA